MGYKRKLFNDKTMVIAGAIGVLAVSAVIGGVILDNSLENEPNGQEIVDLDEETTTIRNADSDIEEESEEKDSDNILNGTGRRAEAESESNEESSSMNTLDGTTEEGETTPKSDSDIVGDEATENVNASNNIIGLNFSPSSVLVWPVEGNVIIDFDMENTVYFATLDLYKCSDAVCVQATVDTPVYAGSACTVESIEYDSEIGNNITVALGNGYMMTYGQLKDVQVEVGDSIEEGELLGYVGSPTKYYSIEGSHLYMKMMKDGIPVDPLDYLNYE